MRPGYFCKVCRTSISGYGKTGCCPSCAQKRRPRHAPPPGEKIETIRASVLAGIRDNFKNLGKHPDCKYCRIKCGIPAFQNSEITLCPRMDEETRLMAEAAIAAEKMKKTNCPRTANV